jgi:hypothetical protein
MPTTPSFRWKSLYLWAVVAAMLMVLVPCYIAVQEHYQAQWRAWSAVVTSQNHLNFQASREAWLVWSDYHRTFPEQRDPPLDYAMQYLNAGAPLQPAAGNLHAFEWTSSSGRHALLGTAGDSWTGVVPAPITTPPRPGNGLTILVSSRQVICLCLAILWVVLALLVVAASFPLRKRSREPLMGLSIHLLLLAATGTLLASIGPSYGRALGMFQGSDPAGWGWVALIASGILLRFQSRRLPDKTPRCDCGYNLTGNISGICPECGKALAEVF